MRQALAIDILILLISPQGLVFTSYTLLAAAYNIKVLLDFQYPSISEPNFWVSRSYICTEGFKAEYWSLPGFQQTEV